MDSKEPKGEHLVALKVMRLTRPTLITPPVITCDVKDLPSNILNNDLKNDVTAVSGLETIAAGQFLLLPQSFGNIYLGETFSSYICVHNCTNDVVKDVSLKADLQTSTQRINLSMQQNQLPFASLGPNETVDGVIHHEVKEIGTHILVCEVSYNNPIDIQQSFRKFFKFQVVKPLDIITKFYNAESDEVYLEATIQNVTAGPMCLEKVSLESSDMFKVTELNSNGGVNTALDNASFLQPQTSCNLLYCLSPRTPAPKATNIGKLDIVWRSNMGERGRLQTSQLERIAPEYGDIRLSVQEMPNIVPIEQPFEIKCRIFNTCERSVEVILKLKAPEKTNLLWIGLSGRKVGTLDPGAYVDSVLVAFPTSSGLQNISGIQLVDVFLKRTYEYDDLAQVFVLNR